MTRGIRWIDGREYLLAGRKSDREAAARAALALREEWTLVRVIKLSPWDFLLYAHGRKTNL